MITISSRLQRIKPSPSSMAGQRARELREQGKDVVGLTSGEPDFDTPENIREAAYQAMEDGKTKYTDVGGTPALREAIADKFRKENSLEYSKEQVIVCTGAKQVIFNAFMSTINPGDEVIVPVPYWVSYPDIALLAEGRPVFVQSTVENRFKMRPQDLEEAITDKTRWVVLNYPNNPSGAVYSREELAALAAVLLRHPHVMVLTDDIYEHIIYDNKKYATIAEVEPGLKDRTLTVNGVSKSYAMTGWRLGYAAGPRELIRSMVKLQSQSTSNASSISQAAALEALTGPQHLVGERLKIYAGRRDYVTSRINKIPGLHCHVPEGAFYVFPLCQGLFGARTRAGQTIENGDDFVRHLLDSEMLVALQGAAYGMPAHFRISFATSMERLAEGCDRLERACLGLEK
ncbi:pyridoxal phosphate-dependent aminotransferase [Paralcaligenes ureilyticus]|uniref:Aminotransferase n=1 Tax=Paralcaligenes ureilyticus TaxID=627131 RepID=A0A4R3M599_9BURK|nr:pyridoxal phosphate-dependent aminotransferase [Paralcaligenes ureilyticus]TCT06395.1 aspartate aminotransferase [Paralcaligenes ureilyticus]